MRPISKGHIFTIICHSKLIHAKVNRMSVVLKVISKHCRLESINFVVADSASNIIPQDTQKYLLKLLKSQAESLKELNLVGRRVDLIFEESMFDLWSVLSSMPNLTKLQWAGQSSLHQQSLNL